ncbi:hypothetical protein A0H81_08941 [Grifola frondosa]|uniref:Uncharacterized protein n=1 Tax=Grifola frondosa TaxID=5627 RepID=A0A1C7M2A9_GRIFR|nr:hypothetical protein A0H81_08941 [Grifola frondosa]
MSDSSSSRTQWIYVDDTDIGMQYSGDWARKDLDDAYSHTLTCTAIEVHGYTFANNGSLIPVQATFSVDNLAPYYTTTPKVSKQASKCTWFYNEMLAEGQHTLVVHVVQASSDYPFCFDYIKYPPSQEILQPPQSSPATTTSSPDGVALCSRIPTGAIIGGVIGGITLLALALYSFSSGEGGNRSISASMVTTLVRKYMRVTLLSLSHVANSDSEPLITPFNTHAPPQSQPISPVFDLKSSHQPYDPSEISFPNTSEYSGASVSVIPPESGSEGRMNSTAPRREGYEQHASPTHTGSEPLITPFNTHAPPQSQPISPVDDLKSSIQLYDPIEVSFPNTSEYSGASVSVIPPESGSEGRMISTAPRHQGYEQHASPTQESLAASVQNVELSSTNQAASEAA